MISSTLFTKLGVDYNINGRARAGNIEQTVRADVSRKICSVATSGGLKLLLPKSPSHQRRFRFKWIPHTSPKMCWKIIMQLANCSKTQMQRGTDLKHWSTTKKVKMNYCWETRDSRRATFPVIQIKSEENPHGSFRRSSTEWLSSLVKFCNAHIRWCKKWGETLQLEQGSCQNTRLLWSYLVALRRKRF